MRHGFLQALHKTGCACPQTGWTPWVLALYIDGTSPSETVSQLSATTADDCKPRVNAAPHGQGKLAGAMLLYTKQHSHGEYVFDQVWAAAYARHGLAYYPKLLCAVPFTPVTGPRLLADTPPAKLVLARAAIQLAEQNGLSSLHVLFCHEADLSTLRAAGYMIRQDIQFHWRNAGYGNITDFLATLSHDKRKKLLQDRKRVARAGITFDWCTGSAVTPADLDFLYDCYALTYHRHGNAPYLTRAAFAGIAAALPDHLVLVRASRGSTPIAAALNIQTGRRLYGRYWGAREFVSGLHFETCYLQGIEYAISHGLEIFEGGAQSEHKMARGLLPTITQSAHWVTDRRFAAAIDEYLTAEITTVQGYQRDLQTHTPFKTTRPQPHQSAVQTMNVT